MRSRPWVVRSRTRWDGGKPNTAKPSARFSAAHSARLGASLRHRLPLIEAGDSGLRVLLPVKRAALPRHAREHRAPCRLQAGMTIRDDPLDTAQSASRPIFEKAAPMPLCLGPFHGDAQPRRFPSAVPPTATRTAPSTICPAARLTWGDEIDTADPSRDCRTVIPWRVDTPWTYPSAKVSSPMRVMTVFGLKSLA